MEFHALSNGKPIAAFSAVFTVAFRNYTTGERVHAAHAAAR